jgi:chromosome segregation ATPase
LKNHIAQVHDELKTLYRRIAAEAISVESPVDENSSERILQRREFLDSLITPDDREAVDNAVLINGTIRGGDAEIERLQASLAIDEEKAKIEKYRKMIQDKKEKIAQAEKSIAEYESDIGSAEENIKKLQELL